MKKYEAVIKIIFYAIFTCLLQSCKEAPSSSEEETDVAAEDIQTPVTITSPVIGNMQETIELNATSAFLLKTFVKSNVNGYLKTVNAQVGKYVSKGQELFIIKTKEAESLGNIVNSIDSSLHFEGVVHIKAPGSGYITQLTYQAGDYVQDGEQLAVITDTKSFVFLLNVPYELKPYLAANKNIQLHLPDSAVLDGYVSAAMPTVDAASQTQGYVIKVNTAANIPENLIAKVNLVKKSVINTASLPKACVLTDEVQSEFWIMKLINDSVAVKVPVQKGIENGDHVQILSPPLFAEDKILLTGNYGLSDTARVIIEK
ncbi:HlyD family efflux transporter periplasmic adaptor subunit [Panacibacter ginsenosidivorans]|uniref:HlyD family efflux transporter periplasmic adaptor subunit n=1 Tax=Panacibacter ginsenosidivorans TaxID=1813871 RepID=A0A5B8V4V1_9BACT|nr:efflux RND transporter periplasmic adaptor subunit [Panacibacter ginsenosidivorans]QEC65843.1 HlyD family efflux transporter periplasmic adaptor subunit [Panacibacter ginsenosidivorans]